MIDKSYDTEGQIHLFGSKLWLESMEKALAAYGRFIQEEELARQRERRSRIALRDKTKGTNLTPKKKKR